MAIKVYEEEKKVEYQPFKCLFCYLCIDNCMQSAISGAEEMRAPEYEKKTEVYEIKKD
jgi:formate hydrogenlyase subunit 6/NADH:ubiquinone oxidoreductase subunit I